MIENILETHILMKLFEFFQLDQRIKIAYQNSNLNKIIIHSSRKIQSSNQNQNVIERILKKIRFFNCRQNQIALQINGSLNINQIFDQVENKELPILIVNFDDQFPQDFGQQLEKLGNHLKKFQLNSKKHQLDAINIQNIFEQIQHQTNLQELTLISILTPEGIQKLGYYIIKLKKLKKFDLKLSSSNSNHDLVIQSLSEILQTLILHDLKLNVSSHKLSESTSLNLIKSAIKPQLLNLTLNLENCSINYEIIKNLSLQLQTLQNLQKLKLKLSENNLDNLNILFENLQFPNLTSLYLDLESHSSSNEFINQLSKLLTSSVKLKKLTLILPDNEIEDQAGSSLMQSILTLNLSQLVLDLSYNSIGNETINKFSQILNIIKLQFISINFDDNLITDEGAKSLIEVLNRINRKLNLTIGLKSNGISENLKCQLKTYSNQLYV